MKNCKNCGAKLGENTKVCPNCGAFIDNEDGYILLTDNDIMTDVYANSKDAPKKKKKGNAFIRILCVILTLLIIAGGAFYYFTNIYEPASEKPSLSFETGSGIINDDEKIIYVLLDENSKIEYIHGVSLYSYDKTDKNAPKAEPVSKDYEYTKSIDSTFRAIFFDTEELGISNGQNTYTFEMSFSFYDSEEIFTYLQPIAFSSDITVDASDLIFDHSQNEATSSPAEQTTEEATTEKATTKAVSTDFIYNSYWYTKPVQNGEELIIAAIKFNNDNTYVSTNYYKNGDESWQITTYKGKFNIENGFVVVNNGEATESTYYKIDSDNNSLYEEENGKKAATLTSRKYNSVKNAEDFFGI